MCGRFFAYFIDFFEKTVTFRCVDFAVGNGNRRPFGIAGQLGVNDSGRNDEQLARRQVQTPVERFYVYAGIKADK